MKKNQLEKALNLAEQGFPVFPLMPKAKVPYRGSNGHKDATTDPEKITQMFTENQNANIGIATGKAGLVVIDCDVGHNETQNGILAKKKWEEENGPLPETAYVNTGGGGIHFYYRTNRKISNSTGLFGDGVDIRGNGGYIIAPGSIHPNGELYEWGKSPDEIPIADADDNVLKFIADGKKERCEKTAVDDDLVKDEKSFYTDDKKIHKGNRNTSCFKMACDGFKHGLTEDVVQISVGAFNDKQCDPPLPKQEVIRTVISAKKHVEENGNEEVYLLDLPCAGDVVEKEVEWFEKLRIPKNHVTFLVADGGDGKSTISCAIAAAHSAGRLSFLSQGEEQVDITSPQKILMLSGEDTMDETIARRLRKNGACMNNISYIDVRDERLEKITLDSTFLKNLLEQHRPDLVVIDPIQSFIPRNSNMVARNAMRKIFGPLVRYGAEYDTTFLMVAHTNKRDGVSGRKRMSDSSDMWDLSRSVLIIGRTPENGVLYIAHEKSNFGPKAKTILFSLEDEQPVFKGFSSKSDHDYVSLLNTGLKNSTAKEEASQWLLEELEKGELSGQDLDAIGKAAGFSKSTLDRAKKQLKNSGQIMSKKTSGNCAGVKSTYSIIPIPDDSTI